MSLSHIVSRSAIGVIAVLAAAPVAAQLQPDQGLAVDFKNHQLTVVDAGSLSVVSSSVVLEDVYDAAVTPDGTAALAVSVASQRLSFVDLTVSPPAVTRSIPLWFQAADVALPRTNADIALITGFTTRVVSVDVATQSIVQTLWLPVRACSVDLTPDGSLALVSTWSNDATPVSGVRALSVSPTGALTDLGQVVTTPGRVYNVTVSPDGRRALAANHGDGQIEVFDISGSTVAHAGSVPVGSFPESIAFTPSGDRAYVLHCSKLISVLDLAGGSVTRVGTITLERASFCAVGIDQIAITANGARLLARHLSGAYVIDPSTNEVLEDLRFDGGTGGIATLGAFNDPPRCGADFSAANDSFLSPAPGSFVVTEGETITVPFTATDPGGDALNVTSTGLPGTATLTPTSGSSPLTSTFAWTPTAGDKPSTPRTVTVTFSDPSGESASAEVTIADVNLKPVCDAGGGTTGTLSFECTGPFGAEVTLNGSATDPDDDDASLMIEWAVPDSNVVLDDPTSATPTGTFPIGVTMATMTVSDGRGGVDICDVSIEVVDATPPDVECTTDLASLWPPRHDMRAVEIVVAATDVCEDGHIVPIAVTIRSDEPDDSADGADGHTVGDVDGQDGFTSPVDVTGKLVFDPAIGAYVGTVELRAERLSTGDGRSYTIDVWATDSANNVATTSCVITVPSGPRGQLGQLGLRGRRP